MAEIAAAVGLLACTGGFIYAGVTMGTHYIDRALRLDETVEKGAPLVRRSRPSGSDWPLNDAA
jgi:hypothetical protein